MITAETQRLACYLRIEGLTLDIDRLLSELDLEDCATATYRRGEPTGSPRHRDGSHFNSSGCNITISDADFAEFEKQVADALECLTKDHEDFESIRFFEGVESITLDLGVQRPPDQHDSGAPRRTDSTCGIARDSNRTLLLSLG